MTKQTYSKEFIERQGEGFKTTEEARELGRKGGIQSGVAKRRKKTFQEAVRAILEADLKPEIAETIKSLTNLNDADLSNMDAIISRQYEKAVKKGDTQAAKFLAEQGYGAPVQPTRDDTEGDKLDAKLAALLAGFIDTGENGLGDGGRAQKKPKRKSKKAEDK